MFRRVYLDANVWIAALDPKEFEHDTAVELLNLADEGRLEILASSLMPIEVLGSKALRHDPQAEVERRLDAAFQRSSVSVISPDPRVVRRARSLRIDGLRGSMDAIHLASAEYARAEVLMTSDMQFRKQALGHSMIPVLPPEAPDQPLFRRAGPG